MIDQLRQQLNVPTFANNVSSQRTKKFPKGPNGLGHPYLEIGSPLYGIAIFRFK